MSAAAKRNHEMGETWLDSSLRLLVFLALGLLVPTFPVQALAQSNDIALSLGGIPAQSRTLRSPAAGSTQISADVSLGANYGHRLLHAEFAALYAEIPPQGSVSNFLHVQMRRQAPAPIGLPAELDLSPR